MRDGEVEELQQAASKGVGLRVIRDKRLGFAYGTDFSKEGLKALAERAVALAKGAARDDSNTLPEGKLLGSAEDGEYDPAIEEIAPEWKLAAARAAEQGARAEDPRVKKFDSTGAGDFLAQSAIASSRGARGESRASFVYVYCSPVAEADGQFRVDHGVDGESIVESGRLQLSLRPSSPLRVVRYYVEQDVGIDQNQPISVHPW